MSLRIVVKGWVGDGVFTTGCVAAWIKDIIETNVYRTKKGALEIFVGEVKKAKVICEITVEDV